MRGGILIIGSLLWEVGERDRWRGTRLRIDDGVHVRVPIYYGRRSASRGNTFTMTFAGDGRLGQAVLAPCRESVADPPAFMAEAAALWKAEQQSAMKGAIGALWGCVGILFRAQADPGDCLEAWTAYFQKHASPIFPVDKDGALRIPWPVLASDGCPADADVVFATATRADTVRPLPGDIADAWIKQDEGHELYFFENVLHGIRTPEDLLIWRRIEEAGPAWLQNDPYKKAVTILRREIALGA